MKQRLRKPPLLLGVAGAVIGLILAALIFTKDIPLTKGWEFDAVFSTSNGVRVGSPVRIAGVDVGKVVGLEKGPGTTRVIRMQIREEGRPIHRDAQLRIRPRLFLEGGYYLELEPGSPSAPEIDGGHTIPLPQTTIPVQFDQVLTTLDRPTRDSLQRVVDEVDVALDSGGAEELGELSAPLAPALRDVAVVSEAARGTQPRDVSNLVRGAARATRALASRDRQLASLVTNLARSTGALAAESDALGEGLREIDRLLDVVPGGLRAIEQTVPELQRFVADLRPALRAAPGPLRATAALLTQVRALARPAELPRLVSRLRPSVRDLPELESRLTALFPLVTPVTDCVRDKAVPVLNAKLDDGALSTGRPVWQDLAHALVGLSSAQGSFDGNGFWTRYLAGASEASISLGDVPGYGRLAGTSDQPIVGVSPRWLGRGVFPPFRPDAPCTEQPVVNLKARTGAATVSRARRGVRGGAPAKRVSRKQLRTIVRKLDRIGDRLGLDGRR